MAKWGAVASEIKGFIIFYEGHFGTYLFIYFLVALRPKAGHGIPIHEVSRSQSHTHTHIHTPHSVGLLWTSDQFVTETSP